MRKNQGFTLIETLLVMGIFLALSGISFIGLSNVYPRADLNTQATVITSDVKSLQLKAMSGYSLGVPEIAAHGMHIESDKYTLFSGDTFNPADSRNIEIELSSNQSLSASNIQNNNLIFAAGSGEIQNFISGATITLTQNNTGKQKDIEFNLMGVVTLP